MEAQLGTDPGWRKAHDYIWQLLETRGDYSLTLNSIDEAMEFGKVHTILTLLTRPEVGFLELYFYQIGGPNDGAQLPTKDTVQHLQYFTDMDSKELELWASEIGVGWKVRTEKPSAIDQ